MEERQIRVSINAAEAGRQLKTLETEVDSLITKLENLEITPEIDMTGISDLEAAFESIDPIVDVGVEIDADQLNELETDIGSIDTTIDMDVLVDSAELEEVVAQSDALQGETIDFIVNVDGREAIESLDSVEDSADGVSDIFGNGLPTSIGALTSSLGSINPAVAAAVAAFATIVAIGLEVQSAVNEIQIATGKTGEALEELRDVSFAISQQVPDSLGDIAAIVGVLDTFLGTSADEAERLGVAVLQVSDRLGESATQNAEDLSQVLNSFNVEAKDGIAVIDDLTKVTQNYGIGFGEVLNTLERAGPKFQAAGFGIKESAVFIGELNTVGIKATKALSGLDILFGEAAKNGEGFGEALQRVNAEIVGAETEAEALNIAMEAFGDNIGVTLGLQIRNGRLDLDGLSTALGDTTGLVAGLAEDTRTAGEDLQIAFKNLKVTLAPLAETIVNALTQIIGVLTTVFEWLLSNGALEPIIKGFQQLADVLQYLSDQFLNFGDIAIDVLDHLAGPLNELIGKIPGLGDPIESLRDNWDEFRESVEGDIEVGDFRFKTGALRIADRLKFQLEALEEDATVEIRPFLSDGFSKVFADFKTGFVGLQSVAAELTGPVLAAFNDITTSSFFSDKELREFQIQFDQEEFKAQFAEAGVTVEDFLTTLQSNVNENTELLAQAFSENLAVELANIEEQLKLSFEIDTENGINDVRDLINEAEGLIGEFKRRQEAAEELDLLGLDTLAARVRSGELDELVDDVLEGEGGTNEELLRQAEATLLAVAAIEKEAAVQRADEYALEFAKALENSPDAVAAWLQSAQFTEADFVAIGEVANGLFDNGFVSEQLQNAGVRNGEAYVNGLTVGVLNGRGPVAKAVSAVAGTMVNYLKAGLGIQSPSTVGISIGEQFDEGIALGVGAGATETAIGELVSEFSGNEIDSANLFDIASQNAVEEGLKAGEAYGAGIVQGVTEVLSQGQIPALLDASVPGAGITGATPFFAGGTIDRPTLAMMGEIGREHVIPTYADIGSIRDILGESNVLNRLEADFDSRQQASFMGFNAQAAAMGQPQPKPSGGSFVDQSHYEFKVYASGESTAAAQLTAREMQAMIRRQQATKRAQMFGAAR